MSFPAWDGPLRYEKHHAETSIHEAKHCILAYRRGVPVKMVTINQEGEDLGCTTFDFPVADGIVKNLIDSVAIGLAGYVHDPPSGRSQWPPTYEDARSEHLEGLDRKLAWLAGVGFNAQDYDVVVDYVQRTLADPENRRQVFAVAAALNSPVHSGTLSQKAIEMLATPFAELPLCG